MFRHPMELRFFSLHFLSQPSLPVPPAPATATPAGLNAKVSRSARIFPVKIQALALGATIRTSPPKRRLPRMLTILTSKSFEFTHLYFASFYPECFTQNKRFRGFSPRTANYPAKRLT